MVTKGPEVTAHTNGGVLVVEPGWEHWRFLQIEGCRNDREKVNCRGTGLVSEMGPRIRMARREKRHALGLDPGNFAGNAPGCGGRLLLLVFGARLRSHFGITGTVCTVAF